MLTDDFLQKLITCPKRAIKAERKQMLVINRSRRNNISLVSVDGRYTYTMFLRQSADFMEDFSVGLIWTNAAKYSSIGKDMILVRFQGPHDSGKPFGEDLHHDYHIHQLSAADISERRFSKPSNKGISREFSSFEGAVLAFIKYCGIVELEAYIDLSSFTDPAQQLCLYDL